MASRFPRVLVTALASALLAPSLAAAQAPDVANVEVEPIACYWRTSADAVRVGEPFTLVLTCSVLDTAATTVVPDESRLDPGALQLQPFEVLGGRQAPNLRSTARRYFQYEYQLRYVGEEVGRDLQLPPLTLAYRVQSRVQQTGGATVEGRERQYILPAHAIRIVSIVPVAARNIRDLAPVTLADIDARRFRASTLRVAAMALYLLSGIVAVWAAVAVVQRRRTGRPTVVRHVSDSAILGGARKELEEVRRARGGEGWTPALAARALAALRIGAAYDAGLPVAQVPASPNATSLPGQLRLAPSILSRGPSVLVSGAATPVALARVREAASPGSARAVRLETLESALLAFSRAAYGRENPAADGTLDASLTEADTAMATIRRQHSWPATWLRVLRHRAGTQAGTQRWQRS